jgi:molybdenum cofactor biosynthesis protein B
MEDDNGDETGRGGAEDRGHDQDDPEHEHGHDHDHGEHRAGERAATVAVVTVSTTLATSDGGEERRDESGRVARRLLEDDDREVIERLTPDDEVRIAATVGDLLGDSGVDAVVTSGGTGLTPDDVTPEAVRPLFDRELPGFGELFRRYSEREIGTRTILSRATAGVAGDTAVFCLPGSPDAVRLGLREVVLPEVDHVVGLARR